MRCRVGVWGLGWHYWRSIHTLLLLQELGQLELVGVTAREVPPADMLDGMPVLSREELAALHPDILVVMSSERFEEIAAEARSFGFASDAIVSSQILETPHLDFDAWWRLRKNPPSILSNNAWGAIVAQTLQIESRSPLDEATIGCDEFLRLLGDVPSYVAQHLEFLEMRYGRDGALHPWFTLGDVTLGFERRAAREDVERLWAEKVGRIDCGNLFAAMTTHDRSAEQRFEGLEAIERRCCFVPYATDRPHSMRIAVDEHEGWLSEVVEASAGRGPKALACDTVALLSGAGVARSARTAWTRG